MTDIALPTEGVVPGLTYTVLLNSIIQMLAGLSGSAAEPDDPVAYRPWIDTSGDPALLKLRNAANSAWVTIAQLTGAGVWTVYHAGAALDLATAFDSIAGLAAATGGIALGDELPLNDISAIVPRKRKITVANLLKAISLVSDAAEIDDVSDLILIWDASASDVRVVHPALLLAGAAVAIASQATMEAASNTTDAVTAGRQQFHPGHAKAAGWIAFAKTALSGSISSVNTTTDQITWSATHGLVNGDLLQPAGGWPSPIGGSYVGVLYAHVISTTAFTLHTSLADALSGASPVNLTSNGSGTRSATRYRVSAGGYGLDGTAPVEFATGVDAVTPTVKWATAFSSSSYSVLATPLAPFVAPYVAPTLTSTTWRENNLGMVWGDVVDGMRWSIMAFGDQ